MTSAPANATTSLTFASDRSVTVIAKHTVQCADNASIVGLESPVKLSPFDQLVVPTIPVAVVFVYKQPQEALAELIPVERLKRALSLLLDHYPHLTGRLRVNPTDGTRNIDRLGTGAELLVAQCSSPLETCPSSSSDGISDGVMLLDLPGSGNALLPPIDPAPESVSRHPIFAIQHTRFACGGVALGVRLPHTICDAEGFFQLVRDLAELYRGLDTYPGTLSHPPHIRPYLSELMCTTAPEDREAALAFKPLLYHVGSSDATDIDVHSPAAPPPPPVVGRVLHFSGAELSRLKAHATNPDGTGWVSTFEALSAHLWQRIYRARLALCESQGVPPSEAASRLSPDVLAPLSMRGLSRLALPPRYFSNALLTTYTSLPHDALAHGPLWPAAKAAHDMTRAVSAHEAERTLRWIAAQPDVRQIRQDFRWRGGFMASQWNKIDMYAGTAFDVDARGRAVHPVLVAPPFTVISLVDGLVYFLPTEEQARSGGDDSQGGALTPAIDVYAALSEPLWAILEQDEELRQFRHV